MIQSNKPLVVRYDIRSGKAFEAVVNISITAITLNVVTKKYDVTIQDKVDKTLIVNKIVSIDKATYEGLKASIINTLNPTETGMDLELILAPHALLTYVQNDVREDGKLIYGSSVADWELVPEEVEES